MLRSADGPKQIFTTAHLKSRKKITCAIVKVQTCSSQMCETAGFISKKTAQ